MYYIHFRKKFEKEYNGRYKFEFFELRKLNFFMFDAYFYILLDSSIMNYAMTLIALEN